jgi:hypothetical protein
VTIQITIKIESPVQGVHLGGNLTTIHENENRFLAEKFGTDIFGHAFFRVVWSEDMTEIRFGKFNEFVGDRFIRTVTGNHRVRKYNYIHSRWILEKYFPPEVAFNEMIPESREGSYEPIFVFEDKDANPLPITLRVLDLLCSASSGKLRKADATEMRAFHEKLEQKEIQDFIDSIDTSPLQSLLHSREAIGYTKELKDK